MVLKKFRPLVLFLIICLLHESHAQLKNISLEEIWDGSFRTESLDELSSLKNGREYVVLHTDPASGTARIDSYSYRTLEKQATLLQSNKEKGIPYFSTFEFSQDESLILIGTEMESIFRRSAQGIYYVYDRNTERLQQISPEKVRSPSISPNGKHVAYVFENNLYLYDRASDGRRQLTFDGSVNNIINGVTDWVYEEEFSLVRAYEWNADGSYIAFLRFDESQVPEFTMDYFGSNLYPGQRRFKYPKAGTENSFVSLHLYDLESEESRRVPLPMDYYIPRIKWMNNPLHLSVITMNRHQNRLHLYKVEAGSAAPSLLLEETDAAYLDITDRNFLQFLPDDSFIWNSEGDGYNHLYLYNSSGAKQRQITSGPWEVTEVYGYDPKSKSLYYQSTENGSINRDIYRVGIKNDKKKRLSQGEGTHQADFSADFSYYIGTHSTATQPPVYSLHQAQSGKNLKRILDNSGLVEKLSGYRISPKEFGTLEVGGNSLNMWMVKPRDFDPNKKYPLLLFQYSGPGSQEVANTWLDSNDYWHQVLVQAGYIVACIDGRGTGFRGREFKKLTYRQLGKYEVEDQIASAEKLSSLPYIDPGRTGIWGWSYGGFMASNCILKGNKTFELAIAVAPVTSWRFYDTIYTERYMRTPAENPSGYDDNSPLFHADKLEGEYLLVHGSGDDNVHVQNTMQMINALVQANKQFDWAIYPDRAHGISGGNTRLHLYTKMTDFLKEHL